MYELCALLKAKKAPKVRKPSRPAIRVGASVEVHGKAGVVTRRDTRYTSAWFVEFAGVESLFSFSRDMISVGA